MRSESAGDERLPPRRNRRHDLVPQVVVTVANVRGRVAHAQEVSGVEGCVRVCVWISNGRSSPWELSDRELRAG